MSGGDHTSATNTLTFTPVTTDLIPQLVNLQQRAYARNRQLLGVEPLPLQWDYKTLLKTCEAFLIYRKAAPRHKTVAPASPDPVSPAPVSPAPVSPAPVSPAPVSPDHSSSPTVPTPQAPIGGLILRISATDLLIESIAVDPAAQGDGVGRAILAFAEERAQSARLSTISLYTGKVLVHLTDWYQRHGFEVVRIEALEDREITHLAKTLR